MTRIILDGKDIPSKEKLHEILKIKLELPDYYGENLNALWDCLTGWIELPLTIEFYNFRECEKFLGEYALKLLEVFKDAEKERRGFKVELK